MKIIDLWNKIANKEDLPEKIKLQGYDYIFTLREDCAGYKWYGEEKTHKDIGETICQNLEFVLRCEIEILDDEDEEKELPEKLENKIDESFENSTYSERRRLTEMVNKINEIIDYLEKQSKGE